MKTLIILLVLALVPVLGACVSSALYTGKVQKAYPATGQLIGVNGSDVHALSAGDSGPVVLMIHGASANAREFEWTLAPRLSGDHRIVMVDRPGHGYSERPKDSQTLAVQAAQAAGALQALAPGERAVVVGHSFGGAVALRLALDFPDLVDGLVLLAPVTHDWGGGSESWFSGIVGNPVTGPVFSQLVPLIGPSQAKKGIEGVFSPQPAPDGYYEKSAIGLLLRPSEFRANTLDVNALRGELAGQQDRYPELTVPVVVFSGALDTVIKPQLHVGKLKHQVEDLELVALADEGHMPHHAYGEDVAAVIRRLSAGD